MQPFLVSKKNKILGVSVLVGGGEANKFELSCSLLFMNFPSQLRAS